VAGPRFGLSQIPYGSVTGPKRLAVELSAPIMEGQHLAPIRIIAA
jgi:hypothetical protein